MLQLALRPETRRRVSTVELAAEGPRYTVDTLAALQAEHPGARLAFIVGLGQSAGDATWREPERLLSEYRVIAVDRPASIVRPFDPELVRACSSWKETRSRSLHPGSAGAWPAGFRCAISCRDRSRNTSGPAPVPCRAGRLERRSGGRGALLAG